MTLRYNNKCELRVKCAHLYFSSTAFFGYSYCPETYLTTHANMRAEAAVGFHANGPLFFKETVTCQHILAKLSKTPKYKMSRNFIRRFYSFLHATDG